MYKRLAVIGALLFVAVCGIAVLLLADFPAEKGNKTSIPAFSFSSHTEQTDESLFPSEEAAQPEDARDSVMLTSGDPLHHIRLEFGSDCIRFSGIYCTDGIKSIKILQSGAESRDLSCDGSSFSGTVGISGLDTGYNILRVTLDTGAIMDYVFEKTAEGSRPVQPDGTPAERNAFAAENPYELPQEGVLLNITSGGDAERAAEVLTEIREISDSICDGITDNYDKVRAIARWVSSNLYYDKDASEAGVSEESITLEAVLKTHRSVCFGWANLFAALCEAQNIECFVASGSVVTGSRCFQQTETADERSHSWNMVKLDGRNIWVDTVWCSSNTYRKGSYSEGKTDMQYFDIIGELLANDHRVTRFEHRDYF